MDDDKKPKAEPKNPGTVPCRVQGAIPRPVPREGFDLLRGVRKKKKPDQAQKPVKIPLEVGGQVTITIEIQPKGGEAEAGAVLEARRSYRPNQQLLERTDRVFVDVTAYNSKNYFVAGDVAIPGRLPYTGNRPCLTHLITREAIPSAEPQDIRLVRPARGGKPAKVYKVDLKAIQRRETTGSITSSSPATA